MENKVSKSGVAIAINYDGNYMNAPEISVLGKGVHAEEMLRISERYGVPIKRNAILAQKLEKLEVSAPIPEELYQEVAQIFISLNQKR